MARLQELDAGAPLNDKSLINIDKKAQETDVMSPNSIPIHRLSSDELIIIFTVLRDISNHRAITGPRNGLKHDHPDNSEPMWDWTHITHVCQYWRITALDAPPLWSRLTPYFFTNPERTRVFLARSKGAELTIDTGIPGAANFSDDPEEAANACLVQVHKQIDRIWEIRLRVDVDIESAAIWKQVQTLLTRPAPRLQLLGISFHEHPEWFKGHLEKTRFPEGVLNIRPIERPIPEIYRLRNISGASGLRMIKLSEIDGLAPLAFLSCLQSCPNLEALSVEEVSWDVTHGTPPLTAEAIVESINGVSVALPKLTFISVSFEKDTILNNEIFARLDIPSTAAWKCTTVAQLKEELLFVDFYKRFPWPGRSKTQSLTLMCEQVNIQVLLAGFAISHLSSYQNDAAVNLMRPTVRHRRPLPLFGISFSYDDLQPRNEIDACLSRIDFQWRRSWNPTRFYENIAVLVGTNYWKAAISVRFDLSMDSVEPINDQSWSFVLLRFPNVKTIFLRGSVYTPSNGNMHNFLNAFAHLNPDDSVFCSNLLHLTLWIPCEVQLPELSKSFVQDLTDALRLRKRMGFGLRGLCIPECAMFLDAGDIRALEELVGRFDSELIQVVI